MGSRKQHKAGRPAVAADSRQAGILGAVPSVEGRDKAGARGQKGAGQQAPKPKARPASAANGETAGAVQPAAKRQKTSSADGAEALTTAKANAGREPATGKQASGGKRAGSRHPAAGAPQHQNGSSQAPKQAPSAGANGPTAAGGRDGGGAGPGPSSNWAALRASIGATGAGARKGGAGPGSGRKPRSMGSNTGLTPLVALDCEMVGVGPGGVRSALARVAVVNAEGNVLLDVFVRPKEAVTDYRTKFSGVRAADLAGPKVVELEEVQAKVAGLLKGRLLVGHALSNDLKVLLLDHPHKDVRDTARYPPLMRSPGTGRKPKPRALRVLAAEQLGLDIQSGEHSPVDDARAALYLYLQHRKEWEAAIKGGTLKRSTQAIKAARKAAMGAAAAAVATGAQGASSLAAAGVVAGGGLGSAKELLTAAQRRALRQGKSLKRLGVGVGARGSGGSAAGGGKQAGAGAAGGRGAGRGPASMALDQDEVAELVASAAAAGAAGAGRGAPGSTRDKMARALARDVFSDPMADL